MRKKLIPKGVITTELIQEYLDDEFSGVTLSKGYDNANGKQNATCTIVINDPKFILGKVSLHAGLKAFEVSVTGRHIGGISCIDVGCKCHQVDCIHQATFLFYLLKQKGVQAQIVKDYSLVGNNAKDFRKIPYSGEQLGTILDRFHDTNTGMYGDQVNGLFESSRELKIKVKERRNWYHREQSEVVLRRGEEGIDIKCLMCSKKTDQFCDHQAKALSRLLEKLPILLDDWENYFQTLLESSAKAAKVSTTNFSKYFKIGFDDDTVGYAKNSDNIVDARWLEKKNDLLSDDKIDRKEEGKKLEKYPLITGASKAVNYLIINWH